MKILAIRGCNLASLAGEFEIDLAKGPLGAAGVFAIVGPTGAGKSTLLDAMCVALFDRTPRLANRSTVVVGRGDDDPTALGAQDVRSILRRGASSGWAEVDFESGDTRRYRARWSVRRARNATDGRFQSQQVTLTTLDGGEALGGTKTETLEAIHSRLGLSFDQFRRSALLAQGEFAAFLRADGKDRSELLERMTGTEIYSRLSIAAHQRAALAEQQLRERHGAALAIPILADDERAKAHTDLALAKDAQQAARARLVVAQSAARWLAEDDRRTRALAEAEASLSSSANAMHLAATDRAELGLRRRAEALRPLWDDVTRLDRQLALAQRDAAAATDAATRADAGLREIDSHRARLVELHAPIREARISAGLVERDAAAAQASPHDSRRRGRAASRASQAPRNAARSVVAASVQEPLGAPAGTVVAAGLHERAIGAATKPAVAAGVHERASGAVGTSVVGADLQERAIGAATSARWLLDRIDLGGLVAGWRDLDATLAEQAALAGALATFDAQLAERARSREQLVARRTAAAGAHQAVLARLAEAQAEAAGFEKRRGLTLDAARRAEDEARRRCAEVERLVAIAAEARSTSAACAELLRRLDEIEVQATGDAELRKATEIERDAASTLRAERTRMLDELRKAAGYEHDRAELVDGEPCPLCGAEEHPWAGRGTLDALIVDAQAHLADAMQRFEAARETLAAIAARVAHRTKERTRLTDQRAAADAALAAACRRWREQLLSLGELVLVDDAASDAARDFAAERATTAQAKLEAARAARSQAEAVAKAAADAQSRVQARQADVEHAARGVRELDASIAALDAAAERQRGEQTAKQERHAQLVTAIASAFTTWHAALAAEDTARPILELALSETGDLSAPMSRKPHVVALLERSRRALADVASAWSGHAEVVVDVDAELGAAIAAIDDGLREAERLLADTVARRDTAAAAVVRAAAEHGGASGRLEDARIDAGFAVDELRRLLADPPARVEQLAQRLEGIDRALDRARTLVNERRRHVDDHRGASPFLALAHDEEAQLRLRADAAHVEELDAMVTAADRHVATLIAALAADDDARARRVEALARHAAAEQAAEVDRVLGEVIGSHDGKLFRSFAQSLTLDGLLAVANSHLDELAPRYQLERVPKHDLELQVIDRDLGNEIRSVQSLSGGESFLVSLALALGLSSMSAHDVRVRTLLIDEGFGTLDPTTLDAALAVLDALQATGRQVGVISHVPALVERVGAHVRVLPRGGGKSDVIVADS